MRAVSQADWGRRKRVPGTRAAVRVGRSDDDEYAREFMAWIIDGALKNLGDVADE